MTVHERHAHHDPPTFMAFFKEDLQFMAGAASSYGNIEHGFSLFGLRTHGDSLACMLAVNAGPNAVRSAVSFHDDHEFIMKVSRFLFGHYGIQYIGNAHSHHDLGLAGPSGNDQRQIHNVSAKNNIRCMGQIIITYEHHLLRQDPGRISSEDQEKSHQGIGHAIGTKIRHYRRAEPKELYVKFNSYIYPDAQRGSYQPMKIRLLDGANPIREQLSQAERPEFLETIGSESFPLDRIVIDEYVPDAEDAASDLPDILTEKILSLPEAIRPHCEMALTKNHLTICFEISDRYMVTAKYSIDGDCPLEKLTLGQDNHVIDVTEYVSRLITTDNLSDVYEQMSNIVESSC